MYYLNTDLNHPVYSYEEKLKIVNVFHDFLPFLGKADIETRKHTLMYIKFLSTLHQQTLVCQQEQC
jgi:hypothetical protein